MRAAVGGEQAALQDQGPVLLSGEDQRVVDRERGAVGELHGQREVVLGVRAFAGRRREGRDAHELPARLQRNGQHGTQPDRPGVRRRALGGRQGVEVDDLGVELRELRGAAGQDLRHGMPVGIAAPPARPRSRPRRPAPSRER